MTRLQPDTTNLLQRMVDAVERVRQRLLRTSAALTAAGIPHAIAGGNAVAAWVSTVDRSAVRNTVDVDVLLNRADLAAASRAMAAAGFVHQNVAGVDLFLDGPNATPREAVHVIFAGEMVHAGEPCPNPSVDDAEPLDHLSVLSLEALVRVKLTAFRRKDQVHLLDMLEVGLIDQAWLPKLHAHHPMLAERLQHLIDTPDK